MQMSGRVEGVIKKKGGGGRAGVKLEMLPSLTNDKAEVGLERYIFYFYFFLPM